MDHKLLKHPLQATSVALLVALTGCVTQPGPQISSDTRARLSQALKDSGDPTGAAAVLQQPTETSTPVDALTHATALVTAGQVDQGLGQAKLALGAHGDDLATSLEVGRLAVRSGRLMDASAIYQQISARHPDSVEALNGQGVVMAQQGDLSGAAGMFKRVLSLNPADVPGRNNLAMVTLLNGETGKALSMLEELDRSAGTPEVKATLALAREKADQADGNRTSVHVETAARPVVTPSTPAHVVPAAPASTSARLNAPPSTEASVARLDRRIVLRARAEAWMQVKDEAGHELFGRELQPGQTWSVPNKPGLVFVTGNAGGTELVVDGVVAPSLGGSGMVRRNVPLDPDMIKEGKLPEQIRAARVAMVQGPIVYAQR